MTAKTKLGRLVRHQCVEATGVDLTLTLCRVDRGKECMPSCFMNEGNLLLAHVYVRLWAQRVLQAGSASRG